VNVRWVLRAATRRIGRSPLVLVALTVAFAVVAALVGAADTLGKESARATGRLASNVHVVAYLDSALREEDAAALVTAFLRLPGVASARKLDGRAARAELEATLRAAGDRESLVAGIEPELFPRSIELGLAGGDDLPRRAKEVAARLGRVPGITAVDAMTDGLAKVAAFATLAARLATLFSAVAGLAALALLGAIVLRERSHHQELAETLHLLGARPVAMWLPMALIDGVAAALGGGAGFILGAWLTMLALGAPLSFALPVLGPVLAGGNVAAVLASLVGVGLFTGWLSLPRPRGLVARAR
jgi:cell division transport system permease protein